ncbi:MAG: hypothetical protein M3245_05850 [Actinomycetota bacterium]|nr:hypothetical protein [Actinomycetota bacterium]
MSRRTTFALLVALVVGLVPLGGGIGSAVNCPDVSPEPLSFAPPKYIDRQRAGGEPVSIVAQDGSISVSAHAGTTHVYKDPEGAAGARDFAVGYTNQTLNWRSVDDGETWEYIGLLGQREGPHSATSTGFSDPDFAIDAGGRIYNTEIDLANVAVFSSTDDGQSYPFANPEAASGDRPWLTGGEKDEVYLYVNLPRQLWRSNNGGLTFTLLPSPPINAKAFADPRNPTQGLIGPVSKNGIAISSNKGQSWTTYNGANLGADTNFFGVSAVDSAGHVYKAAAGGYTRSDYQSQHVANGEVTFNYFDRDKMAWGDPITIPTPRGDALWPWVTAGDDGRVAVTWYQNLEGKPNEFYIYVAYTMNGHGTTVTCEDGSTQFIPPQFQVVNASGRPIHDGVICLNGTTCNVDYGADWVRGDRRLGDFFTINFDKDGELFIASGDTMLRNPLGGPKPVGNPIFIKQTGGDRMLEEPMKIRPTRCLFPLPSC